MNKKNLLPHKSVPLIGLHAYCERSIFKDEPIRLKCSSQSGYTIKIHHLAKEIDDLDKCALLYTHQNNHPITQDIHPGSYILIEQGLPPELLTKIFSFQIWVRTWETLHKQYLFYQFDEKTQKGIKIGLNPEKEIFVQINHSIRLTNVVLKKLKWHLLTFVQTDQTFQIFQDEQPFVEIKFPETLHLIQGPLLIGAGLDTGRADSFLDADIASPAVYNKCISGQEVLQTYNSKNLCEASTQDLIAAWLLKEESGSFLKDHGNFSLNGVIVNHGTWMIGGPSFDSYAVPRYENYSPLQDPQRGHGLRLCSDDLYDCNWLTTDQITLPTNAPSGLYLARFYYEFKGEKYQYDLSFCVKERVAKNNLLVLTSQNTWVSYNTVPFPDPTKSHFYSIQGAESKNTFTPKFSCYRDHIAGQPAFYFGSKIPFPSGSPSILFSTEEIDYSQGLRMERFFHTWLEKHKISFDILPDSDLDSLSHNLNTYKCIALVGHSEYWSTNALEKLDNYLKSGGNLLILSGNTSFWRVSFDADEAIMECRKWEHDSDERKSTSWHISQGRPKGTLFHSQDKERGGLLRESKLPSWHITGSETATWWVEYEKNKFGVYEVKEENHFLYHMPLETNLKKGDSFGKNPIALLPSIIGHETDLSIQTILKLTQEQTNLHPTSLPLSPSGFTILAEGKTNEPDAKSTNLLNYFSQNNMSHHAISEVYLWQRPQGGQVFNVGSVAAPWPLHTDEKYSKLILNVLSYFGI